MAIILENVSYNYNNQCILNDINLSIKSNAITSIIGISGSGKTTLAEIISLITKPSNGKVINNKKTGLVFQNPSEQFFSNTVEKEIELGINNLNKDISQIKKKVNDALIMVGLDSNFLKRNLSTLTLAEQKKVAIAAVLAANPEVIVLDEPTLGLDSKSQKTIARLIKLLKQRYKKTIIVLTEDVEFAHIISDEVIVLDGGKVVLQDNKYEVFTKDIENYGLKKPKIIEFEQLVYRKKKIKLLYRDDINDLMKDIYRNVK